MPAHGVPVSQNTALRSCTSHLCNRSSVPRTWARARDTSVGRGCPHPSERARGKRETHTVVLTAELGAGAELIRRQETRV